MSEDILKALGSGKFPFIQNAVKDYCPDYVATELEIALDSADGPICAAAKINDIIGDHIWSLFPQNDVNRILDNVWDDSIRLFKYWGCQ